MTTLLKTCVFCSFRFVVQSYSPLSALPMHVLYLQDECREEHCGNGQVLQNGSYVQLLSTINGIPVNLTLGFLVDSYKVPKELVSDIVKSKFIDWLKTRNIIPIRDGCKVTQWFVSDRSSCSILVVKIEAILKDEVPYNQLLIDFETIRKIKESEWSTQDDVIVMGITMPKVVILNTTKITSKSNCECMSVNESFGCLLPKIDIPSNDLTNPVRSQCPFLKVTDQELNMLRPWLKDRPKVTAEEYNNGYKICVDDFTFQSLPSTDRFIVDIVLTYGSFAFSAVCCLVFIVIFIKVPVIRTIPTSTIANLVISTMLVQIVYVSSV